MSPRKPTATDEACKRVTHATAANVFDHPNSPLDAIVVLSVWRNPGEPDGGWQAAQAMMAVPEANEYLVQMLRHAADLIERGEGVAWQGVRARGGGGTPN